MIHRFLVWLSAADPDILARCPSERVRYKAMGAAVLTTSAIGAVSCAFAVSMALRAPVAVAVVVGLGWGMALLNIDRMLIGGVHRRDTWWGNLLIALPRVGLALLIGTVVATPLVLQVFENEINAQLDLNRQSAQEKFARALDADPRFARIPELDKRVAELQQIGDNGPASAVDQDPTVQRLQREFDKLDVDYQAADREVICENEGTCGSNKVGRGPAYREKVERRDRLRAERDAKRAELDAARSAAQGRESTSRTSTQENARSELATARADLERLKRDRRALEDSFRVTSTNDRGLLARIGALDALRERDTTLGWAYLLLILLLAALEMLPVLAKLMMSLGEASSYEQIRQDAEAADIALATASFAERCQVAIADAQARVTAETQLAADNAQKIAQAQGEVFDVVLQHWKDDQMAAVNADPDDFLVTGPSASDTEVTVPLFVPPPRNINGAHVGTATVDNVP